MPRLGSVGEDSVCRVPKLTSFSTLAFNITGDGLVTGAAAAAIIMSEIINLTYPMLRW